jgi:hypothetical protein
VRATDAIALAVALALFVSKGLAVSERLIGVRNRPILVLFAVVWLTSAAKRLSEYRRGEREAYAKGVNAISALIAGTGSWYLLFFAYKLSPDSTIWTPAGFPLWVNVTGIALAIIAVIRPPALATLQPDGSNALLPRLSVQTEIFMIAMLLMTGSLVIALMIGLWLIMLPDLPQNPFSDRLPPQSLRRAPTGIECLEST